MQFYHRKKNSPQKNALPPRHGAAIPWKSIVFTLFLIFSGLQMLHAEAPGLINYQGVLSDGSGAIVADGDYDLTFRIYDAAAAGNELWSETQTVTTIDGVFSTMLGSVAALNLPFDEGYWVGIAVDGGAEMSPRMQLGSTPYSHHAKNVADSSITTEKIADGAVTAGKLAPGLSFDQPWDQSGSTLYYNGGRVGIGTAAPVNTLSINGGIDINHFSSGAVKTRFYTGNIGALETYGTAGSRNVLISYTSGNEDNGFMGIYNPNTDVRAYSQISSIDVGQTVTRGPNNNNNVRLTNLLDHPNHGFVAAYDAGGNTQAGIYVNASGQGVVFGDVKNFRMAHPNNPGEEIWYASLEGPEAAAYLRGTVQLVGGKARVEFPEHFRAVVSERGMTVMLTPLSADSRGLAVVEKSEDGFEIRELMSGSGSYGVDWEVKSVRRGFEDYRVMRSASGAMPQPEDGGAVEPVLPGEDR